MIENKQPLDKHDENDSIKRQPNAPASPTVGTRLATDENGPTIKPQIDAPSAGKGMNSGLARALVGGLIGATLGTLAGTLANKRTVKGANYAAKGVGDGAKTVAEGINQAANGVGNAVKSVAEAVNYAVVGGFVDAVKNTPEDAKQSVVDAALDVVKGATEAVKSSAQNSKQNEERLVVVKKHVTTGETVGIPKQGETQTTSISEPVVEPISVDEQNTSIKTETDFLI